MKGQHLVQEKSYHTRQEMHLETYKWRKELERKTDFFRLNGFAELAAMGQGFYLALFEYEQCLK